MVAFTLACVSTHDSIQLLSGSYELFKTFASKHPSRHVSKKTFTPPKQKIDFEPFKTFNDKALAAIDCDKTYKKILILELNGLLSASSYVL